MLHDPVLCGQFQNFTSWILSKAKNKDLSVKILVKRIEKFRRNSEFWRKIVYKAVLESKSAVQWLNMKLDLSRLQLPTVRRGFNSHF